MRVLVCGGRNFNDSGLLADTLDGLDPFPSLVIHGAACGADSLADEWAGYRGVPVRTFPAQWKKYGRSAGPIRNQTMLYTGDPQLVVAFPGGRGTDDMVRIAKAAGVAVLDFRTPTDSENAP